MPELKLYYPQSHITRERIRDKLRYARLYVDLTRGMCELAFPQQGAAGADIETLLILLCVFVGEAEGRPTTATKIASHSGLPRATVYRRLDRLISLKKVERIGLSYHIAEGVVKHDPHGRLSRILDSFSKQ